MNYQADKEIKHGQFAGVAYRDVGKGFPVVLLHGFPMDGSIWNPLVEHLQKDFRLLVPDLPGSGVSPLSEPLSIASMADAVAEMLSQENISPCIVIGHSMGGYITLALARKYPGLLKGWGLFHASAFEDSEERKKGRLKSMALMRQYGAPAFLRQMIPTLFAAGYRTEHREQINELIAQRSATPLETLVAYYQAMMERPDRTGALADSEVPVLFVIGKEDGASPLEDLLQQVSLPRVADIHIFRDVAHMGMMELSLETSVMIIRQFVECCLHKI